MQLVLVGIPKIHLSVRSLSSFWERPTFSSVLSIRLYFSWVFLSAVMLTGRCLLKYHRHIHTDSRRDYDRLWLWGVYGIHGFVFCKYTISLPCFFKRWDTMLFPLRLMQEWQGTGCNILFMTRHTLSVPHRERWRFIISGYPVCFVSYRSPCRREVWP